MRHWSDYGRAPAIVGTGLGSIVFWWYFAPTQRMLGLYSGIFFVCVGLVLGVARYLRWRDDVLLSGKGPFPSSEKDQ